MPTTTSDGKGSRIFCISMQRSGTTSVGKFFRDCGLKWAGWPADEANDWSGSWYKGDYEAIFASKDFRAANAFEDSPWWLPGFYRILFNRFPGSRFVLLTRDPDAWFQSMMRHSAGNVIGNARIHCTIYRRELEYLGLLYRGEIDEKIENQIYSEKTLKITPAHAEHYKAIYRLHNTEVREFFDSNAPGSLHVGELDDHAKWQRLGKFIGVQVPAGYESHENRSLR